MFRRKPRDVPHADLIDLLLDADAPTRKLLIFEALQAGTLGKSEADDILAMASRLERAAGPRSEGTAHKAAAAHAPARAA